MRGRVENRTYDTETAVLIKTLPDGTEIYKKKGRAPGFFRYNPAGETDAKRFRDLTPAEAVKYLPLNTENRAATNNSNTVRFKPHDLDRIRVHAACCGLPINQFLMMLVNQYEQEKK